MGVLNIYGLTQGSARDHFCQVWDHEMLKIINYKADDF